MAAVDFFLKIDGIEGESRDVKHKNEIDVLSWSWGETNEGGRAAGTGGGAGKVSMQGLHFVAQFQKASTKLFSACATGQHIKQAVLSGRRAGERQEEFIKIELSDVVVSSYQTGGSSQDGASPTDQVSLSFAKIALSQRSLDEKGQLGAWVTSSFDVKSNKPA